jgi:hypothetical protein
VVCAATANTSGKDEVKGDAAPSGWIAEQTSWMNPLRTEARGGGPPPLLDIFEHREEAFQGTSRCSAPAAPLRGQTRRT